MTMPHKLRSQPHIRGMLCESLGVTQLIDKQENLLLCYPSIFKSVIVIIQISDITGQHFPTNI